jgi:nucleotide-binding universal stress UspA family protein
MAHYQKLLVTTDFSERAAAGVKEAARLADVLGAKIVYAYVVQDRLPPMMLGSGLRWQEIIESHEQTALEALDQSASELLGDTDVETVVRIGNPADSVIAIAEEKKVDMIVMASHGYGLMGQIVLGSTTERVLKRAPCPVLVVRCRE